MPSRCDSRSRSRRPKYHRKEQSRSRSDSRSRQVRADSHQRAAALATAKNFAQRESRPSSVKPTQLDKTHGDEEGAQSLQMILDTVRDVCDQIEDNGEQLGTKGALRMLHSVLKILGKEVLPEDGHLESSPCPSTKKEEEYTPHFTRTNIQEAEKAVQGCIALISDAFRKVSDGKAAGAATQLTLTFDRPAKSAKAVAPRLRDLFKKNPEVLVEWLQEEEGLTWKKPGAASWFAEKGGDQRKVVHRVHVPARQSFRKPSKMSLQYNVESRVVTIQSTKQNLLEYAAALVAAFGPVGQAAPLQTAGHDFHIARLLPKA